MKLRLTSRLPAATSASMMCRHAAAVVASGFSHSTGLPAAMQASTNSSWVASKEATTTRSTSGSAISASGSGIARPPPSAAAASARAASASATAATCAPSPVAVRVRTWSRPIIPAPMTPTPTLIAASHRRREVHVPAVVGRVLRLLRPAAGDDLAACVELDPLRPVDVLVAEQRRLPAAERVEGHRDRDRDVDADHPDLDLALEVPRGLPGGGEDRRPVGVRVGVDEVDRLAQRLHPHDAQHRAEDLVAVDVHLGRDAVEQRGADEEPVALDLERAAVDDDVGAPGLAGVDVARDPVARLRG